MKLSDPEVNTALKEKLANQAGRHLYLILGSYDALHRYERVAYPELRTAGDKRLPAPVHVSRQLLDRFQDEELRKLAGSELRQVNHIKDRLYNEFDQILVNGLENSSTLTLKQVELLFAFDIELDRVRIRAVNQKHILLMLPGEMSGERITLFHEASPEWHRTLAENAKNKSPLPPINSPDTDPSREIQARRPMETRIPTDVSCRISSKT